jgi:hypothetical protein
MRIPQRPLEFIPSFRAALILVSLALSIPGCATLFDFGGCSGHEGKVVDGVTGSGVAGAILRGHLPTYRDHTKRTRSDGSFCYQVTGHPGAIEIEARGYRTLVVPVAQFLRQSRYELWADDTPKSRIFRDKDDLLTPMERKLLDGAGIGSPAPR